MDTCGDVYIYYAALKPYKARVANTFEDLQYVVSCVTNSMEGTVHVTNKMYQKSDLGLQ